MVEYTKVNVKLSDSQIKKIKDAVYHMNHYWQQGKKQK